MIKKLLVIGVLLINFTLKGQNLVPNGDFEGYGGCPDSLCQIDSALFWMNPAIWQSGGGSSDYFNQCSFSFTGISVPYNYFGYQQPSSGNAYAGLYLYVQIIFPTDYREYIEVPLTQTLIANSCYHLEMYVNRANVSQFTTDDIGIYFSDTAITGITNDYPLQQFTPQINNISGNIFDTLQWTLVSGDYLAHGGESFLIIGNFKDDLLTNVIMMDSNASFPAAYVYIDDVSLTPCATGINENNPQTEITIYPNPAGEELTINLQGFKNLAGLNKEIKIYDMMGKEVLKTQYSILNSQINISSLKQGMYFIEINGERKKFVKANF